LRANDGLRSDVDVLSEPSEDFLVQIIRSRERNAGGMTTRTAKRRAAPQKAGDGAYAIAETISTNNWYDRARG
jgi:hypothetical protein